MKRCPPQPQCSMQESLEQTRVDSHDQAVEPTMHEEMSLDGGPSYTDETILSYLGTKARSWIRTEYMQIHLSTEPCLRCHNCDKGALRLPWLCCANVPG